ncbi:unnamed protein product [Amoebophrya sp. A120]|nr:unnamed protein product [Amoebophrya sp. A120]|eukprot:GSA120T00002300001.1
MPLPSNRSTHSSTAAAAGREPVVVIVGGGIAGLATAYELVAGRQGTKSEKADEQIIADRGKIVAPAERTTRPLGPQEHLHGGHQKTHIVMLEADPERLGGQIKTAKWRTSSPVVGVTSEESSACSRSSSSPSAGRVDRRAAIMSSPFHQAAGKEKDGHGCSTTIIPLEQGAEGFVYLSEAVLRIAREIGIEEDEMIAQQVVETGKLVRSKDGGHDNLEIEVLARGEAARRLGFGVDKKHLGRGLRSFRGGMQYFIDKLETWLLRTNQVKLCKASSVVHLEPSWVIRRTECDQSTREKRVAVKYRTHYKTNGRTGCCEHEITADRVVLACGFESATGLLDNAATTISSSCGGTSCKAPIAPRSLQLTGRSTPSTSTSSTPRRTAIGYKVVKQGSPTAPALTEAPAVDGPQYDDVDDAKSSSTVSISDLLDYCRRRRPVPNSNVTVNLVVRDTNAEVSSLLPKVSGLTIAPDLLEECTSETATNSEEQSSSSSFPSSSSPPAAITGAPSSLLASVQAVSRLGFRACSFVTEKFPQQQHGFEHGNKPEGEDLPSAVAAGTTSRTTNANRTNSHEKHQHVECRKANTDGQDRYIVFRVYFRPTGSKTTTSDDFYSQAAQRFLVDLLRHADDQKHKQKQIRGAPGDKGTAGGVTKNFREQDDTYECSACCAGLRHGIASFFAPILPGRSQALAEKGKVCPSVSPRRRSATTPDSEHSASFHPEIVASIVSSWPEALPQPQDSEFREKVGALCAAAASDLGIYLAGAGFVGSGVELACQSGLTTAREVLANLQEDEATSL